MMVYEQDPDVVRWGLHLLDVCRVNTSGSPGVVTRYDKDLSQTEYLKEGYWEGMRNDVVNDEIIAHTLQEELRRLAVAEASGSSHLQKEQQQASVLAQDWLGSSSRGSSSAHQSNQEELGEHNLFPGGEISVDERNRVGPEMMEDEDILDGEMGKRLTELNPVPHVPKINGEIPSVDEATTDHERLLNRLELYDLVELKVSGDGNCQFRSLSDQIYRTTEHHKFVREQVLNQLKTHPEWYENYVPMAYDDYLKKMSKSGEWGDHVTLQAAADSYGVKIFILTSFKDTCYIEILPQVEKSKRIIFLSFWAEVHYNSIYPCGGVSELAGSCIGAEIFVYIYWVTLGSIALVVLLFIHWFLHGRFSCTRDQEKEEVVVARDLIEVIAGEQGVCNQTCLRSRICARLLHITLTVPS